MSEMTPTLLDRRGNASGDSRHDLVTSPRFAEALTSGIAGSELVVFEGCAHAPIYENVEEFNSRTLDFLTRHSA